MEATDSNEHATQQWFTIFKACFSRRIPGEQLTSAFTELWSKEPIPGVRLVTIILTSGAPSAGGIDPLIPTYLEQVFRIADVDISDIMVALLARSKYAPKPTSDSNTSVSDFFVDVVLTLLVRLVNADERPRTQWEASRAVRALGEWLSICYNHESMLDFQDGGPPAPEPRTFSAFETLGTLAISILNNAMVKDCLSGPGRKGMFRFQKKTVVTRALTMLTDFNSNLASALSDYAGLLDRWSSPQVAPRLHMIAKTPPFIEGTPAFSTADIAATIADLPTSNSRYGLYTYLNAALCARPLTDDLTLFNYLNTKYQNDPQSSIVDLIIASFDVLANALQQRPQSHETLCYRSFIANKLPTLLLVLSTSLYAPMTPQVCIQTALQRIDVHPFPPLSSSSGNDGINDTLKKSRQEFVQACVLFQLGSEQVFRNTLGESPFPSGSRVTRYAKDSLVAQCTSNVYRAEELIRELEGMSGNAGAISAALVETLQRFCNSKETMSLRTLCNTLSRRLSLMDVILQYTQPSDLLFPLCNVLDEWTHEEDQSESQPPYEEFASILFLVLAVIHRYQLTKFEIGSFAPDSFVLKLLDGQATSIPTSMLSEEQNQHLTKWVQSLYATDEQGETNGISDETMSSCPPQSFYVLVPTLLEQSVLACKTHALAINTLKGGLEFLLEPFLLPSLIGGLSWLIKHSWEDNGDTDILLQMLHKLLRPDSISGDAQAMHQTIIAMVARPLMRSLQDLVRKHSNRQAVVDPLLEVLRPHLESQRSMKCSLAELEEWCSTTGGGLRRAVRNIISGLVLWSSQAGTMPYRYTHKTIIVALEILGADEILAAILEEVQLQTKFSEGSGSVALEVATAIICAPVPMQANSHLLQYDQSSAQPVHPYRTLRQALQARLEAPKELLSMKADSIEALVRLGRRVDAQQAVTQLSMPMTTHDMMQDISMTATDMQIAPSGMTDTTGAAAAAAAANPDFAAAMGETLDMNTSGVNDPNGMPMDLSSNLFGSGQDMGFDLGNTSQQQGQDMQAAFGSQGNNEAGQAQNSEEDIFAGLDMGDDDFIFS